MTQTIANTTALRKELRKNLRRDLRAKRRSLSTAKQQQAAQDLLAQSLFLPDIQQIQHVALYLANDGEIDPSQLIQWFWQQGKNVYLPVIHATKHNSLQFVHYTIETPMTKNKYGILEPSLPYQNICPAEQLDWVLLPLVGFDTEGGRLGMGGGYYDRTFEFLEKNNERRPKLIGLAHELQKLERLPVESWDIPLAGVITDKKLYNSTKQESS